MTFHLSLTREGYYEFPNILKKGRGTNNTNTSMGKFKDEGKIAKRRNYK